MPSRTYNMVSRAPLSLRLAVTGLDAQAEAA
jgi:hypothetical protein